MKDAAPNSYHCFPANQSPDQDADAAQTGSEGGSEAPAFDLVFLVLLRNVDDNASLADVIVREHGLRPKMAPHIQYLLEGSTEHSVLLILDGYDEYRKGTNKEVDRAVESGVCVCVCVCVCVYVCMYVCMCVLRQDQFSSLQRVHYLGHWAQTWGGGENQWSTYNELFAPFCPFSVKPSGPLFCAPAALECVRSSFPFKNSVSLQQPTTNKCSTKR